MAPDDTAVAGAQAVALLVGAGVAAAAPVAAAVVVPVLSSLLSLRNRPSYRPACLSLDLRLRLGYSLEELTPSPNRDRAYQQAARCKNRMAPFH